MTTLILGGAGFVGLNIAEALLGRGRPVTLFDRSPPPQAALTAFSRLPGRLDVRLGDVADEVAIRDAVRPDLDAIVLGAAVTADAARDASDPGTILRINLLSQVPVLERARAVGVRRLVNLSSVAAYGAATFRPAILTESVPAEPESLYAITKFASERVAQRLGDLWELDIVSVRFSTVFGPWERATGVRDTLSPPLQLIELAEAGRPAILERPGTRDWLYGPDAAEAVVSVLDAPALTHRLFNVTGPGPWPLLDWGRRLEGAFPGFACRLAEPGEAPNVQLHAAADRPPLHPGRLRRETGWSARFGLDRSADDYVAWRRRHG